MVQRAAYAVRRYPLPAVAMCGLSIGLVSTYAIAAPDVARLVLGATLVIGGLPVVLRTVRGMLRGSFASDIVATLAIVGAAVTQEYLAGCVIVLMQTGGEALEDYAVRRASASLQALLTRAPKLAHRRSGETVEDVPAGEIAVGDAILVRPGDLVPVDGVIVSGTSAIDESALTGEPVPITGQPGNHVMSGSMCLDGALEIRAERVSGESQYEQIVRLVQAAQKDKAPIGRLADRYAVFFTPITLFMCALAYGISRQPQAVVAVLVVATPCPLILATPVAIISGINRAARNGIIVKGGAAVEQVGEADAVVFDKTGTLTAGTPAVDRVVPLDGYSARDVIRLGAALEQFSSHPMARALVQTAVEQGAPTSPSTSERGLPLPTNVTESPGQGVFGRVEGHLVDVGSIAFAVHRGLGTLDVMNQARADVCLSGGAWSGAATESVAVVGVDRKAAGLVIYADPPRPDAPQLMQTLKMLGINETVMLTGDDRPTAEAIASAVGINTVKAELLPADKVAAVEDLMRRHHGVVMVGDGINDAPALATATVGVALGAHGTAVSAEAADIVILTDNLSRVGTAIEIGKHTLHIARQSIFVGLGVSSLMMVVAAFGYIPPTFGAVLQEMLDVGVILNALRAR